MTGRMSPHTEARLTEAVGAVADLTAGGMDPTEATVKVAKAYDLLPGQIGLVATAYNTGAAAAHRKTAATLDDRAADIPLVDTLLAVRHAFRDKTAASDDAVRPQFLGRPARGVSEGGRPAPVGGAIATTFVTTKKAERIVDNRAGLKRMQKQAADDRTAAERAYEHLVTKLAEIATYFRRDPRISYSDAWSESVARHGKSAAALFETVQTLYPEVVRAAPTRPAYLRFDLPPHSLVADGIKLAETCASRMDDAAASAAHLTAATPEPQDDVSPVLRKFAGMPILPQKEPPTPKAPSKPSPQPGGGGPPTRTPPSKPPAGGGPSLQSLVTGPTSGLLSQLQGPSPEDMQKHRDSVLRAIVDPYAMNESRGQNAQLMLTDLMQGDPVIASHDPSKVLAHYNELSQLAPRLMAQGGAARAVLRQRLESGAGGIDPFQIDQLLKAENALRDRDNPAYGKGVLDT